MVDSDVVVTADVHLRPDGVYRHRGMVGDLEYGFEQVVAACEADPPAMLVVLGDIFEARDISPRSPVQHRWFQSLIDRVAACSRFGYVLGNHDLGVDWTSLHPDAELLHEVEFEVGGRRVYGLNYADPDQFRRQAAVVPDRVDTLMAHQAWAELMGQLSAMVVEADWVPDGVRSIITGDYHRSLVVGRGGRTFYSPGPVCLQRLDEPAVKSFLRLTAGPDGWAHRVVPLRSRGVARFVASDDDALDLLLAGLPAIVSTFHADERLPADLRRPVVAVDLGRGMARRRADLVRAIGRDAHLFVNAARGRDATPLVERVVGGEFGLRAAVMDCLPAGELRDLALRLAAADDVAAEVDAVVAQVLAQVDHAD